MSTWEYAEGEQRAEDTAEARRGAGRGGAAGKSDPGWDREPKDERASGRGRCPQHLAPHGPPGAITEVSPKGPAVCSTVYRRWGRQEGESLAKERRGQQLQGNVGPGGDLKRRETGNAQRWREFARGERMTDMDVSFLELSC